MMHRIPALLKPQTKHLFSKWPFRASLLSRYIFANIGLPLCGAVAAIAFAVDVLAGSPELAGLFGTLIDGNVVWAAGTPLAVFALLFVLGAKELSHWGALLADCASFSVHESIAPLSELLLAGGLALLIILALRVVVRRSSRSFAKGVVLRSIGTLSASAPLGLLSFFHVSRMHVVLHAPSAKSTGVLLVLGLSTWNLLRPSPGKVAVPCPEDLRQARLIADQHSRSDAGLMLMGDKSLLFSASKASFLAYAKCGRTWGALYDPVGPREEWQELVAAFIALSKKHGGTVAFYQVHPEALQIYVDAGLTLMKVGEDAWLDLTAFAIEGAHRSHLRYALRRGQRDGLSYRLVPANEVASVLSCVVSDAWLNHRSASERCFSIAAFEENFMKRHSAIVVYRDNAAVAFASYMLSGDGGEATTGVMRVMPDAPACTMEYLFTNLAFELKACGLTRFGLGVAPFSGIKRFPGAAPCNSIGYVISRHGSKLYNFRGLRAFKEKFLPNWTPRYLAASGGLGLYRVLFALPSLTGADAHEI
ncbi:phosphatidylglycerol lysyltransferase domain-containing protein [Pandoraea sp. CB10b_02]|uniref:phosphatidylglycerol lysyltransferase domain-containing protein n=1 Tax=Pandoraea sp. CB10b_02 TaxID=2014535 RepID=UPI00257BCE40|nr:phosphatidylglycerol lysyltransferase domain-containing protein [Pandoraea sp. CB10b_02]